MLSLLQSDFFNTATCICVLKIKATAIGKELLYVLHPVFFFQKNGKWICFWRLLKALVTEYLNMLKNCFISYNLFSNKGKWTYALTTFSDECGKILPYLLQYAFLNKNKRTCLLKMLANQCGKGLLYLIDTKFLDKVDNCFSSYNPYAIFEKGR